MFKLLSMALVVVVVSAVTLLEGVMGGEGDEIVQPLAFNHKLHMEQDVTCVECHLRAADGAIATLPPTRICMLCHEEPQGESPEEPRVREFAELGDYIPWIVVNKSVGHVYFSHEAHVTWGAMECNECHGDMGEETVPLVASQVEFLTMEACMDCHFERGASNDCLVCHK